MPKNLQELPRLKDSISHIYLEYKNIEQNGKSIMAVDKNGKIPIPIASLTVLMIGPGCTITHAAIKAIAENGCMAIWCGEHMGRFYAMGTGETRSSANFLAQVKAWSDQNSHLETVKRMYTYRFHENLSKKLTLEQLRGKEGVRVRQIYKQASDITGIRWNGRTYDRKNWQNSDPINRAISAANACLYGICHAAIVSLGYSPALGFVHTGKQLSFVYDIADLYKAETIIPLAFQITAENQNVENLEREIRKACIELFHQKRLLDKIPKDIPAVLGVTDNNDLINMENAGFLWSEKDIRIEGGKNYGEKGEDEEPW